MQSKQHLKRRRGAPKAWTANLCRKLIALDIFTNLTNDQLLYVIRGSTDSKGVRSLQSKRKLYFGTHRRRWSSRDASQMHRRISHLHAQYKTGHKSRIFSLPTETRKQCQNRAVQDDVFKAYQNSQFKSQTDLHRLKIRLGRGDCSTPKSVNFRIVLARPHTSQLVETCQSPEVVHALDRIAQLSISDPFANPFAAWSADFAFIDLNLYQELMSEKLCDVLRHRVTELEIDHCRLYQIPQNVGSFSRLTRLDVSRNRLKTISACMLPCNLTRLYLGHNSLLEIPEHFAQLTSLQLLDLTHNSIKVLPPWLSQWKCLAYLLVEGNPLSMYSYSYHYQAFQPHRENGINDLPENCLRIATRSLKGFLSTATDQSNSTYDGEDICACQRIPELTIRNERRFSQKTSAFLGNAVQQMDSIADDMSLLRNFLQRMSFQSDDIRSSVSAPTLRSISSAGSSATNSYIERRVSQWSPCCERAPDGSQTWCIHVRTANWLVTRAPYYRPQMTFTERDLDGNSVLHVMAAFGASPTDLRDCIERGFQPTLVNHDGETFLHRAITTDWDESELVKLFHCLTRTEFCFTHQDHYGNTIFHKSHRFINCFASNGFCFNPHLRYSNTVSHDPKKSIEMIDKVQCLKTCCGPQWRNSDGMKVPIPVRGCSIRTIPTWVTCLHGPNTQDATARLYMKWTIPSDVSRPCSHTECATTQPLDVVHGLSKISKLGYQTFEIDQSGQFLDICAALHTILEAGVDVNAYTKHGTTPLMHFIRDLSRCLKWLQSYQVKDCIEALLFNGANVHAKSRSGETALHYAVYYGLPDVIEPLITAGANVNSRNRKGLSVLQLLDESIYRERLNLKLFARYQQCSAILADHLTQMNPGSPGPQWTVGMAI